MRQGMMVMEELEVGYLTLIDLGGDPYKEKNILRTIDINSGSITYYDVKINFAEKPEELTACPLCGAPTIDGNEYGEIICKTCNKILKLAIK
jgi:hypothetical protein